MLAAHDAAGQQDDEYGDFEDLETGEIHGARATVASSASDGSAATSEMEQGDKSGPLKLSEESTASHVRVLMFVCFTQMSFRTSFGC